MLHRALRGATVPACHFCNQNLRRLESWHPHAQAIKEHTKHTHGHTPRHTHTYTYRERERERDTLCHCKTTFGSCYPCEDPGGGPHCAPDAALSHVSHSRSPSDNQSFLPDMIMSAFLCLDCSRLFTCHSFLCCLFTKYTTLNRILWSHIMNPLLCTQGTGLAWPLVWPHGKRKGRFTDENSLLNLKKNIVVMCLYM